MIHLGGGDIYHASWTGLPPTKPQVQIDREDGRILSLSSSIIGNGLKLQGIKIGVVTATYPFDESALRWDNVVEKWLKFLGGLPQVYSPTGQDRVEAFWRTLIADVNERPPKKHPAPNEYGRYFHDWLLKIMTDAASKKWSRLSWYSSTESDWTQDMKASMQALSRGSAGACLPTHADFVESMDAYDAWAAEDEEKHPHRSAYSKDGKYLFERAHREVCGNRTLFVTADGYIGFGPGDTSSEDEVWIVKGARVPFVLRTKFPPAVTLLGEAYVHGAMHGELVGPGKGASFVPITVH